MAYHNWPAKLKKTNVFRNFATIVLLVLVIVLLVILGACSGEETPTTEPTITASATLEQATQEPEATSLQDLMDEELQDEIQGLKEELLSQP